MRWEDCLGHEQQLEWFRNAAGRGRLASSFLFVGQEGIGKRTFARMLAKSLLCRRSDISAIEACGACEDCAQVEASTHPDMIQVSKPEEKSAMPIELLIGEREKRMREGLCHDISLKPYSGRRKVAILDDADSLNAEGANCLLKTLEEPPSDSLLILIGTGLQRQLPTIRSRCQTIVFRPLSDEHVAEIVNRNALLPEGRQIDATQASMLGGSVARLGLLENEDFQHFRKEILKELSAHPMDFIGLAKNCSGHVDSVGKEARLRRERLRLIFEQAADLYRSTYLLLDAGDVCGASEAQTQAAAQHLSQSWRTSRAGAIDCWQRCLRAIEQVERNANQTALLESWAADLAALSGR